MIKIINNINEIEMSVLKCSHYGQKVLSYLNAYGIGYDFCRFFSVDNGIGYILFMNSTMVVCGNIDIDELYSFIRMNQPFRVEAQQLSLRDEVIPDYRRLRRTMYAFPEFTERGDIDSDGINSEPALDDVYEILKEGFPNLIEYSLWLTDTSRRIRTGVSKVFTYKNAVTASILYDIDGDVLIGQVATRISERGKGYAGNLLRILGDELYATGKKPALFALDIRRSFYEGINFKEISVDYVFEKCLQTASTGQGPRP